MNDQGLFDAADSVVDVKTFIAFLDALRLDWEDAVRAESKMPSPPYSAMYGWENTNIGSFLEAAVAGATDNRIAEETMPTDESAAWKQAAEIILLGKIYE